MPVCEHRQVSVRALLAPRTFLHPFFPIVAALNKQRLIRIVHHGHPATGENTLLHTRKKILDAAARVDGTHRTEQVLFVLCKRGHAVYRQVLDGERAAFPLHAHLLRLNHRTVARTRERVLDRRHHAIDKGETRTILEQAVLAPFAADHAVREKRKPRLADDLRVADHHRARCGADGLGAFHLRARLAREGKRASSRVGKYLARDSIPEHALAASSCWDEIDERLSIRVVKARGIPFRVAVTLRKTAIAVVVPRTAEQNRPGVRVGADRTFGKPAHHGLAVKRGRAIRKSDGMRHIEVAEREHEVRRLAVRLQRLAAIAHVELPVGAVRLAPDGEIVCRQAADQRRPGVAVRLLVIVRRILERDRKSVDFRRLDTSINVLVLPHIHIATWFEKPHLARCKNAETVPLGNTRAVELVHRICRRNRSRIPNAIGGGPCIEVGSPVCGIPDKVQTRRTVKRTGRIRDLDRILRKGKFERRKRRPCNIRQNRTDGNSEKQFDVHVSCPPLYSLHGVS